MISRYKVVIEGKNPDYFLKELLKNKIYIYDLEKYYKKLIITISSDGLDKLKELKTSYKYHIVDSFGPAKIKYLFHKYFFFLVCLLLGISLNIYLSNIIFSVEIIHPNSHIKDIIFNNLKENNLTKYKYKVNYSKKEEIVEKILKKETNDIEWLEIEEVGTKYIIKVEQRKKNKEEAVCIPQNIVALKDARLLQIQAETGEVVKKKNDYVKKGDIIISGEIHNKDEVVSKRCATGKIYGEVWYKVNLEIPTIYKEENVTGKQKYQLEISFLNKNYTIFNNFKTYKRKSTYLVGSKILPITLNFTKYLETKVTKETYNLSNVDEFALSLATSKLKTKLSPTSDIISKKVLKKNIKYS